VTQPLSQAERLVLHYLWTHGPATHTSLTAELIEAGLGDSLRLGAMMIAFRDDGWVLIETKRRTGVAGSVEVNEVITYLLTETGTDAVREGRERPE
jgi:hypothetical protein